MAPVADKKGLVMCGVLWLVLPLLCCAATTSGVLASPADEQHQHQQHGCHQQKRQQHLQHEQQQQVVGGLRKRSGGSTSRLRGGAGSSTGVDLSHPNSSRALAATSIVAAPAAGGRTAAGGGMDADSRKAQVASPVGAQESGPWEKSAARAGRGHETKQGSRRPGSEDDGGDRGSPEGANTGESVVIIFGSVAAVILFFLCGCWLSSVFVCLSWCACKCAKPNSGESSTGAGGKQVDDSYANAVRATFCGTLASVVCVSHGDGAGETDDEAEADPPSRPFTSQQAGNNNTSIGGNGSNSSNHGNNAMSPMNGGAIATAPAVNRGTKTAAGCGDGAVAVAGDDAGSNSSAFSAIFRRSLTATAVPHGTPGVTPTAQDNTTSVGFFSERPPQEQQQQLGDGAGTNRGLSPADGGESGGGRQSQFWEAEEKRGEMDSSATTAVVAPPPQAPSRSGILRLFGSSSSGSNGNDSQPAATWSARVWERLRPAGRRTDDRSLNDLQGVVGTETSAAASPGNITNNSDGFSGPSPEEGSLQAFELLTHRRRLAARVAGSRARPGERGGNSNGHLGATPALSANGNNINNGRGADGVTTVFGCGGALNSGPDATVGDVEHCSSAEVGTARRTPNSRHGGGGEGRETVGEATTDSLPVGDVVAESATAGNSASTDGDIISVTCVDPFTISRKQHYLEERSLEDAGSAQGGGENETGGSDGVSYPPGNTPSKSPQELPRARVLWRAFSEVDHDMIGEGHRRARLRFLERFGPAPGIENPPMCYSPFQG